MITEIRKVLLENWFEENERKEKRIFVRKTNDVFVDWDWRWRHTIAFNVEDCNWNTIKEWLLAMEETDWIWYR